MITLTILKVRSTCSHEYSMSSHLHSGVVDSSGMRYFYTTEEPEILAGAISFGHNVVPYMFVPPKSRNFTITGICSPDCTNSVSYHTMNA